MAALRSEDGSVSDACDMVTSVRAGRDPMTPTGCLAAGWSADAARAPHGAARVDAATRHTVREGEVGRCVGIERKTSFVRVVGPLRVPARQQQQADTSASHQPALSLARCGRSKHTQRCSRLRMRAASLQRERHCNAAVLTCDPACS
jgi:hypothetical protein